MWHSVEHYELQLTMCMCFISGTKKCPSCGTPVRGRALACRCGRSIAADREAQRAAQRRQLREQGSRIRDDNLDKIFTSIRKQVCPLTTLPRLLYSQLNSDTQHPCNLHTFQLSGWLRQCTSYHLNYTCNK